MSIQSSPTHNYQFLNSISQTHHHNQPNLTTTITPSNDSDDDVVFLCSVPKVIHTPEEYDPKCKCSTCKLVKRLLAECTCEECRGQQTNQVNQAEGQVVQSNENITIANEVSSTNVQPSESSIQNNDASTSEHMNGNDQDDDRESRSSTPDYHPRFFDDESGDSSSDDCEDDDFVDDGDDDRDDKELDQNSETEVDHDSSDPDYTLPSTSNPIKKSNTKSKSLYVGKPKLAGNRTASVAYHQTTGDDESNSSQIESDDNENDSDSEQINSFECPKCESNFDERNKLVWHYRFVHLQWKPFYCKWLNNREAEMVKVDPKICIFVTTPKSCIQAYQFFV